MVFKEFGGVGAFPFREDDVVGHLVVGTPGDVLHLVSDEYGGC